jgi:AbrB family looped-hinge helix DNA binding protein
MGHARISRKNQVTLPAAVLRQARVGAGDELQIRADGDGRIVLARAHDPLDDFVGAIPGLVRAAGQDGGRGGWEP